MGHSPLGGFAKSFHALQFPVTKIYRANLVHTHKGMQCRWSRQNLNEKLIQLI